MLPTTYTPSPTSPSARPKLITPMSKEDIPTNKFFLRTPLVILFICLIYILYSQTQSANYWRTNGGESGYPLRLREGWFMGRMMDLSDHQWSSFRSFLPLLAVVAVIYCIVSRGLYRWFQSSNSSSSAILDYLPLNQQHATNINGRSIAGNSCSMIRCVFYVGMSCFFVFYMFGLHAIWPLAVTIVNYWIGSMLKQYKFQPLVTWIFNLVILVTSDYYGGYRSVTAELLNMFGLRHWYPSLAGKLNWATYFNITMCRLISYNMDLRETVYKVQEASDTMSDDMGLITGANSKEDNNWSEYRRRQEEPRSLHHDYNFLLYFMYVFYLPCYIAGPITSYNAFVSYLNNPQKEVPKKKLLFMTAMLVVYVLCLEIGIHFLYSVGLNEHDCWRVDNANYCSEVMKMTSMQVAMTGFMTLGYMFLKFTIIWRFFRVWALWDGQNVPENMTRCIFNNYLVSEFWRSWHRSMYLWIVKYMYVPMGGKKTRLWTVWLIFGFVAIWHDLWWRWIAWAYFNALLMVIESLFMYLIIPAVTRRVSMNVYQKRICGAFLGSLNMVMVTMANLAIMHGFEGTRQFLGTVAFWGKGAYTFVPIAIIVYALGVLNIFWMRDLEASAKEKE